MITFQQSTLHATSITYTSFTRLIQVIRHSSKALLPLLAAMAVLNRVVVYLAFPAGIGQWLVDISQIHIQDLPLAYQLILTIPTIAQYPLFAAGLYFVYHYILTDKTTVSLQTALWFTLTRLHLVILTSMIYLLCTAIGCVFFIFPGIYILGIFSMAVPGVMLANQGLFSSFSFSRKRTKGSVMYTLIILALAFALPNAIFAYIGPIFAQYVPNTMVNEILIIISVMVNAGILICALTFTYIELGLRENEAQRIAAIEEKLAQEEEA